MNTEIETLMSEVEELQVKLYLGLPDYRDLKSEIYRRLWKIEKIREHEQRSKPWWKKLLDTLVLVGKR